MRTAVFGQILTDRNGCWMVLRVVLGEVSSSLVTASSDTRACLGKRDWKHQFSLMERVLIFISEWKLEQACKGLDVAT